MQSSKELLKRSNAASSVFYKMKWHKFLIYFLLWARTAVCLFRSFSLITGTTWGEYITDVYTRFPLVRNVDIVFGVLFLILAIVTIVARFKLAAFSHGSVDLLHVQFIAYPLLIIFYYRAINSNANAEIFTFEGIEGNIILTIIIMVCSHFYYKKRSALFIK